MTAARLTYIALLALLTVAAGLWTGQESAHAQAPPPAGGGRVHLSTETPQAGDDVRIAVELSNPAHNPMLDATVRPTAPDGTTWAESRCTVACEARAAVPPGQTRTGEMFLTVNEPGQAVVDGEVTWRTQGTTETAATPLRLAVEATEPPDRTTVELHASEARLQEGGNLAANLSVVNNHPNEVMRVTMTLRPPEGTSVTATHNAQSCAGECKATYETAPGEQRTMTVVLTANDAGEFALEGRALWSHPGVPGSGGAARKYLVLSVDRPLPRYETPRAQPPVHAPERRRRFPDWTYPAILGGVTALGVTAAAAAGAVAWRRGRRPRWTGTDHRPDARVRMLTALQMVAGTALAVTAVFNQTEGTGAAEAVMLVLPGAVLVTGAGMAQRFLTPWFALALTAVVCPWAGFYIGWSGRADPERAAVNALALLVLIAGTAGICQMRKAMQPRRGHGEQEATA